MKKIIIIIMMILCIFNSSCNFNKENQTITDITGSSPIITAPISSESDTTKALEKQTTENETSESETTEQIADSQTTQEQIVTESEKQTDTYVSNPVETPEFKTDLSKYEKYINPSDNDTYIKLINKKNKLSQDYVPENLTDLIDTRDDGRSKQQMSLYAAKALEAFLIEARANGCENITVTSAYRSYKKQESLFNTYVNNYISEGYSKEEATAKVMEDTALPGASEHQSGLCCDMHNMSSASQKFAQKKEAKWLAENCYKFGFILRYPEDKVDVTGIVYEPWHFRYVGRYHATKMHELSMCLEEYTEYLRNN